MKIIWVSTKFTRQEALSQTSTGEIVLMVDLDRCISCGACQYACQLEHAQDDLGAARPRGFTVRLKGVDREASVRLPLTCRRCSRPCEYHDPYNFWATCPGEPRRDLAGCDLCAARFDQGFMPACATRCSMKCIYFGYAKDMALVLAEKRLRNMGDVVLDCPAEG
jgi:Fe-S-cluster-containing dehydrogenase component